MYSMNEAESADTNALIFRQPRPPGLLSSTRKLLPMTNASSSSMVYSSNRFDILYLRQTILLQ